MVLHLMEYLVNINSNEKSWAKRIQKMFASIAPFYVYMNHMITFGNDKKWRKEAIQYAHLPEHGHVLDLGTGTGDVAYQINKEHPFCHTIAADFTIEMIKESQQKLQTNIHWCAADALNLPFENSTFDAVISGFLLRNVFALSTSLNEQWRILKPGGWFVSLDTTPPTKNIYAYLTNLYITVVVPYLGKLITGNINAYSYLSSSTRHFINAESLASDLKSIGFNRVGFKRIMLGTVAIHWGQK